MENAQRSFLETSLPERKMLKPRVSNTDDEHHDNVKPGHPTLLIVDSFAWELLIREPNCIPGERNVIVTGYEAYIIEQWLCERRIHTVVVSYTGNSNDKIQGHVLYIPTAREEWGELLTQFIDDLGPMHLIPQDTPRGQTFVTNLSSFPSNWTLIPFKGHYSEARDKLILNENFKRFGCLGRGSVSLDAPSEACIQKFRNLFMVPNEVSALFAVREVVTLAQIGLYYFDLLAGEYVDGLLCDHTLEAFQSWWVKIGTPYFQSDLSGVSRQTEAASSVTAVIGLVRGLRTRLTLLGVKTPKDVFAVDDFVKCIRQYQKSERMPRTSHFDATTVWRLINQTAKFESSNFGSDLLMSLKSTMKEGLGRLSTPQTVDNFETCDLRIIVATVKSGRAAYLWRNIGSRYQALQPSDDLEFGVSESSHIPLRSLASGDKGSRKDHYLSNRLRRRTEAVTQSQVSPPSVPGPSMSLTPSGSSTGLSGSWPKAGPRTRQMSVGSLSTFFESESEKIKVKESADRPLLESMIADSPARLPFFSSRALLTQDDSSALVAKAGSQFEMLPELRRTLSASEADSAILRWSSPVSFLKITKLLRKARSFRQILISEMGALVQHHNEIKRQTQENTTRLSAEQRGNEAIRFEVTASSRQEQAVRNQVHELEAYVAKLDYEYAFLNAKLRDVENAVASFGRKVNTISARWALVSEPQSTSFFSRLKTWAGF